MSDPRFELLESYVSEAMEENLRIKQKPIVISYGQDNTDFMIYFGFSKERTNGSRLMDGWTAFAFLANRDPKKSTKGERIMGRRIILGQTKSFSDVIHGLQNAEESKYNSLRDSQESDLPFVFSTKLLPGTWAIIRDERSPKKIERVWLLRKK